MAVGRIVRAGVAGAAFLIGAAAFAGPAQAPRFVALDTLQTGLWQLREAGGEARSMCVRDPASLFQLRGRGAACSRFVIENGERSATVHYTCPGSGHGRTTISVETPRLIRIDSEGIDAGAPFAVEIEARRIGTCPAG